jgi:hypothetical protein
MGWRYRQSHGVRRQTITKAFCLVAKCRMRPSLPGDYFLRMYFAALQTPGVRRAIGPLVASLVLTAALAGCSDPDRDIIRGHGLKVAQITTTARAHVYEAALHAAFHLDDPTLVLLMQPRVLPRTAKIESGDSMPKAITSVLEDDGAIHGLCQPQAVPNQKTPRCATSMPGYVVRFSDVLQLTHDTVEVFVSVVSFDTRTYPKQAFMEFENVYQIAKTPDGWSAAREGRVPK